MKIKETKIRKQEYIKGLDSRAHFSKAIKVTQRTIINIVAIVTTVTEVNIVNLLNNTYAAPCCPIRQHFGPWCLEGDAG